MVDDIMPTDAADKAGAIEKVGMDEPHPTAVEVTLDKGSPPDGQVIVYRDGAGLDEPIDKVAPNEAGPAGHEITGSPVGLIHTLTPDT